MSDDLKIKAENLTLKTCLLQAQNACIELEKKLAEANEYKEMWQSIAGKANLKNLVDKADKLALAVEALKDIHDYGEYSDHRDTPKIWRKCDETLKQLSE